MVRKGKLCSGQLHYLVDIDNHCTVAADKFSRKPLLQGFQRDFLAVGFANVSVRGRDWDLGYNIHIMPEGCKGHNLMVWDFYDF